MKFMNDGCRVKLQKTSMKLCVPDVLKLLRPHCEIFGIPAIKEVRVVFKYLEKFIKNENKEIKGISSIVQQIFHMYKY